MLHPRFVDVVRYLHPNVDFLKDVLLQDDSDGKGAYVVAWNLPGAPPTDKEIDAALALIDAPKPDKTKQEKLDGLLAQAGLTTADLKTLLA